MSVVDDDPAPVCDYCDEPVHRDANGWYVGVDGTSDCFASSSGHAVGGQLR